MNMADRFRKLLPVVIDVETAGFEPRTDALLEVAAVMLAMEQGQLVTTETIAFHVKPFEGANLNPDALAFNKIDPYHPFRFAVSEQEALRELFAAMDRQVQAQRCQRAVLVGHNAWFDLAFIKAASERCRLKLPLHAFTSLDTASLSGLMFGQTVLAKAMKAANIEFNVKEAHSAVYDAEKTAELFCHMVNRCPLPEHLKKSPPSRAG